MSTKNQTPVNPRGEAERRNSFVAIPERSTDNFQERNNNSSSEDIELRTVQSNRQEHHDQFGATFDMLEVRRTFIKKVSGIVGFELVLMSTIMAVFIFTPLSDKVYNNNTWFIIFMVLIFVPLGIVLILMWSPVEKVIRKWPLNITLLTVLVLVEGVILGGISAYYAQESILVAVGLTAGTVVIVSIFAFFTKIDFTKYGGILLIFLLFLFLFGITFMFVALFADDYSKYVMKMIFGAIGAFVMIICLICDTQLMLIGKHKYSFNTEDYVFAALSVFLDIINLVLYILLSCVMIIQEWLTRQSVGKLADGKLVS